MSLTRIVLNGISTGASVKFALYNDTLREQVSRGVSSWPLHTEWYLSDFFVPMAIVSGIATFASLINHLKRNRYDSIGKKQLGNKLENLVLGSALTTAVGFTLLEQINNFGNKATAGDWNDIYCFFGGATAGYLIYALTDVFEGSKVSKLIYHKNTKTTY